MRFKNKIGKSPKIHRLDHYDHTYSTVCPPIYLFLGVAFLLTLTIVFYKRFRAIVSPYYWRLLIGFKILSLFAVTLLLLNPSFVFKTPDTQQVSISFLIDNTASMTTSDTDKESRIQFVKESILSPDSDFHKRILNKFSNSHSFLFAGEELRRIHPGNNFSISRGETDIDFALSEVLENPIDQNPLGAVVLISDGLDNKGLSLMEAAKKYKNASIPIHCIGVGDPRPKPDIGVTWKKSGEKIPKNQSQKFNAIITNKNSLEQTVTLNLFENNRLIESRKVGLKQDSPTTEVSFEHTPFTSGFNTYKIELMPLKNEHNILNNKDFAGIEVTEPDTFNALFFSSGIDWDYKFLNRFSDGEDRLNLDAIIRLGEKIYFTRGLEDRKEKIEGFPECEEINKYDCIIVNLNALYLLDPEELSCISSFVENRGGGILFIGQSEEVPPEIQKLLPIRNFPIESLKTTKSQLNFRPSKVLSSEKFEKIKNLAHRLFLPENGEMYRLESSTLKPGAIEVVSTEGMNLTTLAVQFYGSGKVALLNLPNTWKWIMQEEEGEVNYGVFWGRLISWISSSSKERLTVQPASTRLLLTNEQEFLVDVLDEQFLPDNSAKVSCTIIAPGGKEQQLELAPDPKVDGRYKGKFIPRETGDFRFHFATSPNQGKPLEIANDYIVIDLSPEAEPHPMAERKLQSLARQTGGSYWNYKDVNSIEDLKLTKQLSYKTDERKFIGYWWYFAVILMTVLPDWILRRRIGLK